MEGASLSENPPLFFCWLYFPPLRVANSGPVGFRGTSCEQYRGGQMGAVYKVVWLPPALLLPLSLSGSPTSPHVWGTPHLPAQIVGVQSQER